MNKYDLTITNCAITIDNIYDWNTNEDTNSRELKRRIVIGLFEGLFPNSTTTPLYSTAYTKFLHELQTIRNIELGNKQILYSKSYLIELKLYTDEELLKVDDDKDDIDKNVLLKKHKRSFLLNNIIVQFEDDYEITIENNEHLYYKFLILMLCDYGIMYIDEILDHHVKKVPDISYFTNKLQKQLKILPEILKDKDILDEIETWINNCKNNKNLSNEATKYHIPILKRNMASKSNLDCLFKIQSDYKYINVFTKLNPPLLAIENDRYIFIGNDGAQRGILGAWFSDLMDKNIINHLSDEKLAQTLSKEIDNFTISRASIKRKSGRYLLDFKDNLEKLVNQN